MIQRILVGVVLLFCTVQLCAAGDAGLLPRDGFEKGWARAGEQRVYEGQGLYDHIDGGAENFLELGFEACTVQEYRHEKDEISLEVYRMLDPAAALGIYLTQCGSEKPDAGFKERHTVGPNQLLLVKGRYYFVARSPVAKQALVKVLLAMGKTSSLQVPASAPPAALRFLPKEGQVPGSLRIVRGPTGLQAIATLGEGDILQLGGRVTAVAADYPQEGSDPFTVIAAEYPSPETAAAALGYLKKHLDAYLKPLAANEKGLNFQDSKGRYGRAALEGKLLTIEMGLSKPAPASGAAPAPAPQITVKVSGLARWTRGPGDPPGLPKMVTFELGALARTARGSSLEFSNTPAQPERVRFTFDKGPGSDDGAGRQRQLIVYPVDSYRGLFEGKTQALFNSLVSDLQEIIRTRSLEEGKEIPVLPPEEGPQVLRAQVIVLEFPGGSGIRFLTRYAEKGSPIKPGELFYTFQGVTTDGRFWVSLFWPLSAEGITGLTDMGQAGGRLEGDPPPSITPPPEGLDALVKSIRINERPGSGAQ